MNAVTGELPERFSTLPIIDREEKSRTLEPAELIPAVFDQVVQAGDKCLVEVALLLLAINAAPIFSTRDARFVAFGFVGSLVRRHSGLSQPPFL